MNSTRTDWKTIIISCFGVFFLFGTIGFAIDVMQLGREPVLRLVLSVLLFGLFAIGYALTGTVFHKRWRKALVVMLLILVSENLVMNLLFRTSIPWPLQMGPHEIAAMHQRLRISAITTMVAMALAYACFLFVAITEGRRRVRMQTELELAAEVHRTLVPAIDMQVANIEFYGISLPSGEVGGDLIDVFQQGGGWTAYVADVSGHGVAPGVVMGMVKSSVRTKLSCGANGGLLQGLNSVLCSLTQPETFVTFAYLAADGKRLECALAGHPSILHYHASKKEISEIVGSNPPLGIIADHSFGSRTVDYAPNDLFVLLTDGLLEVADASGVEFGLGGVKRVLLEHGAKPLPEITSALLNSVKAHGHVFDDQSLLLVRARADAV